MDTRHPDSQEFAHHNRRASCPFRKEASYSILNATLRRVRALEATTYNCVDRWCTSTTMDHLTLRRHEPAHLGRKRCRWTALP